ncbi:MAG: hypothetical protein JRJ73_14600 [Deltaproteobacteria bacterium]|nr:hypothetical protein [Deltaproteobacteria bacterium]
MTTSAGIVFKAHHKTVEKMERLLDQLDEKVNARGLGVACVPVIWRTPLPERYYLFAQTHWSYDGENGRKFLRAMYAWINKHGFKIEVTDEWGA